jgi:Ni,Fe-hydrogenase III large subunit
MSVSTNNWAYYKAVEELNNIKVCTRVNLLRMIGDEILRVSSHLFNLNILAHMLGIKSLLIETIALKGYIQDIKRMIFNQRMDFNLCIVGGTMHDISTQTSLRILNQIKSLQTKISELTWDYESNQMIKHYCSGVGILSKKMALTLGAVGPVARASGINNDIRVCVPYGLYEDIKPMAIVQKEGDVYARIRIRSHEIRNSFDLIIRCLLMLDSYPMKKNETECFLEGDAVSRIEAPRGELFCYVQSNNEGNITSVSLRTPSLTNWELLKCMTRGEDIENLPLILNSIDPCVSM